MLGRRLQRGSTDVILGDWLGVSQASSTVRLAWTNGSVPGIVQCNQGVNSTFWEMASAERGDGHRRQRGGGARLRLEPSDPCH